MKIIYLDMDGTIADLYGVADWLPRIRNNDATIYADAQPLVMEETLLKLIANGYELGVITWGSKVYDRKFQAATRYQKEKWLRRHYPNIKFSEFHCLKYGTPKSLFASCDDAILIDDELHNREEWIGVALSPEEFVSLL